MEINPRAAAIAELVLWIGHLQWHVRTKGGMPNEPILKAFKNIVEKDAVLAAQKSPELDQQRRPTTRRDADGNVVEVYSYEHPRRPEWPPAEFIVGNPPFIGGKDIRARTPINYAEALWAAHPQMNPSADYVMYWWDRAADLLTRKGTVLRRFGFVTTNSITQVFQRRVVERNLRAKKPISLVMAIPDHPWTKATTDAAAVRIAMTVGEAGACEGVLREVKYEADLNSDTPKVELTETGGRINADLTVGVDVTAANRLVANEGICSPGVKLHGSGFIVSAQVAALLGLGKRLGLEKHIRQYRNGRDLTSHPRGVMVIDLFGLEVGEVQRRFPEIYQHLLASVKSEREAEFLRSGTRDAQEYAERWWVFGKPRQELRPALEGLPRFIATVETTSHRVFQFLDGSILPDNRLVCIATADSFVLGVLSSRFHVAWTSANGGTLEDRPIYTKSRCFDPFPLPVADELQKQRIRDIAEDLDIHRKRVLADHSQLTLTSLYNVLSKLRHGVGPEMLEDIDRRIFDDGLVLILKELHEKLDAAVAKSYSWPSDLSDRDILARLVALNQERAQEEARGLVRWLRPEYQVPRFGSLKEKVELDLVGGRLAQESTAVSATKPSFPTDDDVAQTAAVMAILAASQVALGAEGVAVSFRQGRRNLAKVQAVLAALARMGFVSTADGGKTFALRRVA